MPLEWFQLWAEIPGVGEQFAGWLSTDINRAGALYVEFAVSAELSRAAGGLPSVNYRILNQAGGEVGIQTWPF